jgi:hypothetical protein
MSFSCPWACDGWESGQFLRFLKASFLLSHYKVLSIFLITLISSAATFSLAPTLHRLFWQNCSFFQVVLLCSLFLFPMNLAKKSQQYPCLSLNSELPEMSCARIISPSSFIFSFLLAYVHCLGGFIVTFWGVLGFKHRALYLLGRCSTTWTTQPTLAFKFSLRK